MTPCSISLQITLTGSRLLQPNSSKQEARLSSSSPTDHKNRKRKIILFYPPFIKVVDKTLVQKHFPESHKCPKIFRQPELIIKVSYSCMDNVETIVTQPEKKTLTPTTPLDQPIAGSNYRNKQALPLKNNCLSSCT